MLSRVGQSGLGFPRPKSTKSLQQHAQQKEYPTAADAYELLEQCGSGVSATVWRALCKPYNEIVAVKLLDLENNAVHMEEITREAATMKMLHHPNVLSLHCSFMHKQHLWMVEPYVAGGSVLNIMKFKHPKGLSEEVIATIVKEVLKGLDYVHRNGDIHRDVKAGNILIDSNGSVKLADFGVAASTERGGSWGMEKQARKTFVGTPCWMAPEVMENQDGKGYNHLADIWSLGITILELAHGHAPFAKFPPLKVLMMTLQGPPPTLEDTNGRHFSKGLRDLVTWCLQKDQHRRPSAKDLLEHKFIRQHSHDAAWLQKNLLAGLPGLPERVRLLREGKAATRTQDNTTAMLQSQMEYVKGVSRWNFDVNALKAEALLEATAEEADASSHPVLSSFRLDCEHDVESSSADECAASRGVPEENGAAPAPTTHAAPAAAAANGAPQQPSVLQVPEDRPASPEVSPSHGPAVALRSGASSSTGEPPFSAGSLPSPSPAGAGAVAGVSRSLFKPANARPSKHGRFTLRESSAAEPESPGESAGEHYMEEYVKLRSGSPPGPAVAPGAEGVQPTVPERRESVGSRGEAGEGSEKLVLLDIGEKKQLGKDKEQLAAKRRGRFNILEEAPGTDARLPRVVSNPALASGERASTAPGPAVPAAVMVPAADELLPKLEELVGAARAQQEGLHALHHAVSEAARGNRAQLLQMLKKPLLPVDSDEVRRLQERLTESLAREKQLEDEVRALRERNAVLETLVAERRPGPGLPPLPPPAPQAAPP